MAMQIRILGLTVNDAVTPKKTNQKTNQKKTKKKS
jgi:hypothetical protein